ncbi:hypothetical protein RB628_12410 [Streptomyces sp. ADMS]|uniref:hypothetical protein n=1 Tax=Streptomyces sp. ADMS TaxID=3071415 RepID=UPI00296EE23C|nr:hypothetical protein [Streptomyces sp. ADMS]MDW4906120.1 hypothetical protein [Streptomyces sp. ADMS]
MRCPTPPTGTRYGSPRTTSPSSSPSPPTPSSQPHTPAGAFAVESVTDCLAERVGKAVRGLYLAAPDANLFDLGLNLLPFVESQTIRSFVDNLADLTGLAPAMTRGGGTTAPASRASRRARRAAARRVGV